jgi:hypothetical protein
LDDLARASADQAEEDVMKVRWIVLGAALLAFGAPSVAAAAPTPTQQSSWEQTVLAELFSPEADELRRRRGNCSRMRCQAACRRAWKRRPRKRLRCFKRCRRACRKP